MRTDTPKTIYLKDYQQPEFWIETTNLDFQIFEEVTRVTNQMHFVRNAKAKAATHALRLNGEELKLLSVRLEGRALTAEEYEVDETHLTLSRLPDRFTLEVITEITPHTNLAFEGLYKSQGMYCTQCEAEGFRKITYYLDRPDVMSVFEVTVEADIAKYPVLLSNGNLLERQPAGPGRHMARWRDPFKKPSYLFALVAGDLAMIESSYQTRSGRQVALRIFCRYGHEERCHHAMNSLKQAMKWDEDVFGLEYDLDIYMIVAVDDFNMGAMENKGLNVFNASYVLAKPETASDTDYDLITGVIGHEYFHNWTGNRITCRDWFQLSLKEGLTVFRDQEFSADLGHKAVKRIEDVQLLRNTQFVEDSGPMAHPVRPQSFIEINNFYTHTVYEKGAEVIRMIQTLVGKAGFRKGMDKYFELFDGQAVTTEDFVHAMEVANQIDLTQFKLWYDQAGTPELKLSSNYDSALKTLTLKVSQSCPATPGQPTKKPFHIPLRIGLVGKAGAKRGQQTEHLLNVTEAEQTFKFTEVEEEPIVSALRGFSAPIKLHQDLKDEDLALLVAYDNDEFNRWEAAQNLAVRTVVLGQNEAGKSESQLKSRLLAESLAKALQDKTLAPALLATLLDTPSENYLSQFFSPIDVDYVHSAALQLDLEIATLNEGELLRTYESYRRSQNNNLGQRAGAERRLKNLCLRLLCRLEKPKYFELAEQQFYDAANMTDEIGSLSALNSLNTEVRDKLMAAFYTKWKSESLVMNKWFRLQAVAARPGVAQNLIALKKDPAFDMTNPNKAYALFGAFGNSNPTHFHSITGEGYKFMADTILEIDPRNPSVASRLISSFNSWRKFNIVRQSLMREQLERIAKTAGLSKNVFEIASKALSDH